MKIDKLDSRVIGQMVRRFRQFRDYTRYYMADMLGIHLNTYTKLENGHFKKLDLELINSVAELLEVSVDRLLYTPEYHEVPQ